MIIKLDSAGRFVIPKFIREELGIKIDGKIKLKLEEKRLIITKVK